MAKQLQLTISTPCHESWDNMTPIEKGKFCGSCQKQVVDFSNMSDRQVAEFFKKPSKGSVCGRFMNDQLDRAIEIPKKRIPFVKYFFQIALPAFLVSIKASAQKTQGKIKTVNTRSINKVNDQIPLLMGVVDMSAYNKTVVNDTITLPEVVVNSIGRSEIKGRVVKNVSPLEGKVAGPVITVVTRIPDITGARDLSFTPVNTNYCYEGMVGGVSVVRTRTREKKSIPLIKRIFSNTADKAFKIFPNPVPAGSNLTIEWKQAEEGYYSMQLLNQSGQSVHQQEIRIDAKSRSLSINVPAVSSGSYFISLTNKKTGKKFTEKIIIQ